MHRPSLRPALRIITTALAGVLVFAALLLPNTTSRLTPAGLLRIPVEALLVAGLLVVLRGRARTIAAAVTGGVLGLLTVEKALDMGFRTALARQFDPVLDWSLFDDAYGFVDESAGRAAAIGAAAGTVLLVLLVMAVLVLSMLRLAGLLGSHRRTTVRGGAVVAVAWAACLALGVQIADVPVAARSTVTYAYDRGYLVQAGLRDRKDFARDVAVDAFRNTPADQMLTGLGGKDVLFAFVESYGRSAVEDPSMGPPVTAALDEGTRRLHTAGFAARSGWLTSPTAGGGSWLAHSTFLSGVWIDNQQRYRALTEGDRLTLSRSFQRTGRHTVAVEPGNSSDWAEASFYGYDEVHDSRNLGYRGPQFGWSRMPDQYTLAQFEQRVRGRPHDRPLMAEVTLTSSHTPWAPIPRLVGWDEVGDGSIYHGIKKEARSSGSIWKDPARIREEYRRSVVYSVNSLISYVAEYGDDNLVLVFLGDHQPAPIVTGENASHDVPITIVARDPKVLDRIAGWGWTDGLKPGPQAPVWRMDAFRDKFLGAYGDAVDTS